eukprot:CAMPEP_0195011836 /NCGR_PEP_ID=MMETSP0326_2-20130528/11310_1 /TAXON_ID=2866 ORGANISM="Crypthecodinium cohnii, Strain Seligo" /NCGR_SAMPLE_ID=MMETSP0326_2 /ASSEMBLY_ACC=CAM_ASM_000348 /LENGTH=152 /DNA_ID=CAMNT_0040021169 /DNA_START=1 /DNA_END=460 /DNA_ORIENTATION=-
MCRSSRYMDGWMDGRTSTPPMWRTEASPANSERALGKTAKDWKMMVTVCKVAAPTAEAERRAGAPALAQSQLQAREGAQVDRRVGLSAIKPLPVQSTTAGWPMQGELCWRVPSLGFWSLTQQGCSKEEPKDDEAFDAASVCFKWKIPDPNSS